MSETSNDKNIPTDIEACYEELAFQEEIYLEETEEELRAILIFDDPSAENRGGTLSENCEVREVNSEVNRSMSDTNSDACKTDSPDEQLNHAAKELITGDSDDPPLSEETVVEMISMTLNARRPGDSSDV